MPRRVLMTSYYMPSASKIGVGHQVHLLANELVSQGYDVTVATPAPETAGARYRTVTIPLAGRWRTFRWAFALRRLDMSGFDVLHAHGDDYWLWRRRTPLHVRTMHGSCLAEALRIGGAKERFRMFLLGLGEILATLVADTTVAVSQNTRTWMPWIREVIPNGVDLTRFADEGARAGSPTIVFVGTYENRKRGRLLMQVFDEQVRRQVPGAQLWMVCSDAPPAAGVEVTGYLTDDQLAERYSRAWVFCTPSTYEGFGIPYIEALAAGTPVVATPNPGSLELTGTCSSIVLVDDEGLGPALVKALQAPPDADTQQAARDEAGRFDITNVAAEYGRIYDRPQGRTV